MNKSIAISLLLGSACLMGSDEASSNPLKPPGILFIKTAPSHTFPLPALPDVGDMPWLHGWPAVRTCELDKHDPYREDFLPGMAKNKSVLRQTTGGTAS